MTSILDARFALDRQLLDRQAAGLPAVVEQVDCVLCEDDETVMVYVYLANTPDVITVLFDRPAVFDRHACAEQLLACPGATVL